MDYRLRDPYDRSMAKMQQLISVIPRGGGEVHAAGLLDPSGRTTCGLLLGGWVVAPGVPDGPRRLTHATVTCDRCKRLMFLPVSANAVPEHRPRAARGRSRRAR